MVSRPSLNLVCVCLSAVILFPARSHAIVRRHDRTDAQYIALGKKFPWICKIYPGGSGSLISKDWVLTAAHVTVAATAQSPLKVTVGGQTVAVDQIYMPKGFSLQTMEGNDIALLHLAQPVYSVKPVTIESRPQRTGQSILLAGFGETGDGQKGSLSNSGGQLRVATNKLVAANSGQTLRITFNPPAKATNLEGIGGSGDSGGPAFIVIKEKPLVIGLSAALDDVNKDGRVPDYGDAEVFTSVTAKYQWIQSVLSGKEKPVAMETGNGRRDWAAVEHDPAYAIYVGYFKAYNSGDANQMIAYEKKFLTPRDPGDDRKAAYTDKVARFGTLQPVSFIPGAQPHIFAKSSLGGKMFEIRFSLEGGKIAHMMIMPASDK